MTPLALALIVFGVVTLCTAVVVVIGVMIDRMAARHELEKGK